MSLADILASRYAQALAALRAIHDFDAWLGVHWRDQCPMPSTAPTASTPLGSAGAIYWHEERGHVMGFLPGTDGCFAVPSDASLPGFSLSGEVSSPIFERDILVSASMREELHPAES